MAGLTDPTLDLKRNLKGTLSPAAVPTRSPRVPQIDRCSPRPGSRSGLGQAGIHATSRAKSVRNPARSEAGNCPDLGE